MTQEDLVVTQPETAAQDEPEEVQVGEAGDLAGEDGSALSKEEKFRAKLKEVLLVEREVMGPLRLKLTITIPRETVEERLNEEFLEIKRETVVPGFRKGHAPLRLVEKRFAPDVGDQLKSQMIANGYMLAVEKEDLKPLGDPLFCVKVRPDRSLEHRSGRGDSIEKLLPLDKALENLDLPKEGPLRFACELDLKPQFELPKLEGIPVRRPKFSISDSDVDEELKRLRLSKAFFRTVDGGTVEENDVLSGQLNVVVEGQVVVQEDGAVLAARDQRYKGFRLSGFGAAVTGKNIADVAVLETVVPDDHDEIGLRGKSGRVDFAIREIKRVEYPPIDEAFLGQFGCETEVELRVTLRTAIESKVDSVLKDAMRNEVGGYLVEHTTMDIPEGLSQRQTEKAVARRMIELYQANTPQAEIDQQLDEMRLKAHDQVVRDFKLQFILDKIAENREIEVSESDLNGAIAEIAGRTRQRFDRVRDELTKSDRLSSLYLFIRDRKVLDTLLESAEVSEVEGPETINAT